MKKKLIKEGIPKTFEELFANTGIKPTTDENGNINYNFKAIKKEQQKQLITEIMDLDAKDGLYEDVKPKIDIRQMTQEEMNEIRNPAYKYFDIDDTVNDTVNELDKLAHQYNPVMKLDAEFIRAGFKAGYKKAQETLYTEEQIMEAAFDAYVKANNGCYELTPSDIIQSLKQSKKD